MFVKMLIVCAVVILAVVQARSPPYIPRPTPTPPTQRPGGWTPLLSDETFDYSGHHKFADDQLATSEEAKGCKITYTSLRKKSSIHPVGYKFDYDVDCTSTNGGKKTCEVKVWQQATEAAVPAYILLTDGSPNPHCTTLPAY